MLTPEQIQFFDDNGYLLMKGLLSDDEVQRLRDAATRLSEEGQRRLNEPSFRNQLKRLRPDWIHHPDTNFVYAEHDEGDLHFHRVERMWTKDAIFRHTTMHPVVLENAAQILGRPFWPRGGSLVYKMPGSGTAVPWHQDIPYYWRTSLGMENRPRTDTYPTPNFTTDFYLEESRGDRGGVWCIPGTHKQGSVDVDRMVEEHGFRLPGAIPLEAEAGDVLFHHVALIHGSDENHSTHLRRTFYQAYIPDDVLKDAYSDWPDLKSDSECRSFWQQALDERRAAGLASEGGIVVDARGIRLSDGYT